MFTVYDNGEPAVWWDEGFAGPELVPLPAFDTFTEAQGYAMAWLRTTFPFPLEPNVPVEYTPHGDTIEIRCSALIVSPRVGRDGT